MSTKFQPLTNFLAGKRGGLLVLTFAQIERMVGPLPMSARVHDTYWHETANHSITHAWLRAGYVKVDVSRSGEMLKLKNAPNEAAAIRARHRIAEESR
jgi:hypothetical protein